jgi:hypothetical protein
MDYDAAAREIPKHVLFNGREGELVEKPIVVKQGEKIRIFFGNAGPNLISSFHVIGTIFDKVYREGDLISPLGKGIQTALVPAGGAVAVEMEMLVPGSYSIVDHSIFRIDKGAVGMTKARYLRQLGATCLLPWLQNLSIMAGRSALPVVAISWLL